MIPAYFLLRETKKVPASRDFRCCHLRVYQDWVGRWRSLPHGQQTASVSLRRSDRVPPGRD
jgi:hypothetical protein